MEVMDKLKALIMNQKLEKVGFDEHYNETNNPPRAVIHVVIHKTGTSSIQIKSLKLVYPL